MNKLGLFLLICALNAGESQARLQPHNPSQSQRVPASAAQNSADLKALDAAQTLLETAGMYLKLGDIKAAEEKTLEALKLVEVASTEQTKLEIRKSVRKQLRRISGGKRERDESALKEKAANEEKATHKRLAQLRQAEYLSSLGKNDEAAKVVQEVLGETDDQRVIDKANAVSRRIQSTTLGLFFTARQHVLTVVGWIIDIAIGVVVLALIYGLLKLLRGRSAKKWVGLKKGNTGGGQRANGLQADQNKQAKRWQLEPIQDTTNLGLAGAVVESLQTWSTQRSPASAGLLKLGIIQVPNTPELVDSELELDLAAAIEDLKLDIGSVSIGGIAKAGAKIRGWYSSARPSISGAAFLSGDQVVVRLTRKSSGDKTLSVTGSAAKERATEAAESASFKMYYLLGTSSDASRAEAANKLREGLKYLNQYLSGGSFRSLQTAYEVFRNVHFESPAYNEAFLYEGVALDLLERHDEALKRFEYLAGLKDEIDPNLCKKAMYNKAVARFRKYIFEELKSTITELEDLSKPATKEELVKDPIKALSYAAKGNAIAHKAIFWQQFTYNDYSTDETTVLDRKEARKVDVKKWVEDVEQIVGTLKEVYREAAKDKEKWDDATRHQLRWAIENALGNAFLNYAKSFLSNPPLSGANVDNDRKKYLTDAHEAFKQCEMLLAPGVETLTNLATVLTELSRTSDARQYLTRAIEVNPAYEYAYYRLAESWHKENRTDRVVEVLRDFAKLRAPAIREFKAVYANYAAELARP